MKAFGKGKMNLVRTPSIFLQLFQSGLSNIWISRRLGGADIDW